MSVLMRSPRESGSWMWEVEDRGLGLSAALTVMSEITAVLGRHKLLTPHKIEYDWHISGGGVVVTSTLGLVVPLDDPELPDRVSRTRPTGFPAAEVSEVRARGVGGWLDAEGHLWNEPDLVNLEVNPYPTDVTVELSVHHDIWKYYDFSGRPHPRVQEKNAVRLASAIQNIESRLGVEAVPGEPTYFGAAQGYGIATPDASSDGFGPDLTDKM